MATQVPNMTSRWIAAVERVESAAVRAADHLVGPAPGPTSGAAGPDTLLPPGPPPRRGRLLGSLAYYLQFAVDPIGFVKGRFDTYGDIYCARSFEGNLYAVMHPDHLYEVLVTRAAQFEKTHSALQRLSQVLGDGLLTSDGDTWKRHRRMIQPAFSKARMAGYAEGMVDETRRAIASFRPGEQRDIDRDMMALTLRVVCRALFSHSARPDDVNRVSSAMLAFQKHLIAASVLPSWLPGSGRTRVDRAIADLDALVYGLIASRRATPERGTAGPPDLLQSLLTTRDEEGDRHGLEEKEIRDELVTLLLAGHETTANTLTWTLYLLSQHRSVEARLHAELDDRLAGRAPTLEDLEHLPVTAQVIKESMRLYPPVYMVARRAREDTEVGGYPVPRGSEVVLWIYRTHHDARWYPEPELFRPERWTPAQEAQLPHMAYLPFGGGARLCIGKHFATLEARLILATLAQRYAFRCQPGEKVEPVPRITLGPRHGLRMTLHSRP
jgi:cytochrome P450